MNLACTAVSCWSAMLLFLGSCDALVTGILSGRPTIPDIPYLLLSLKHWNFLTVSNLHLNLLQELTWIILEIAKWLVAFSLNYANIWLHENRIWLSGTWRTLLKKAVFEFWTSNWQPEWTEIHPLPLVIPWIHKIIFSKNYLHCI